MHFKDLAAFASVADHGSLTRAAAAAGQASSILSRRISALEAELQGRLFHRTGRGVAPTELGMRLLPRARRVLAEAAALESDARGERESPSGTVEIAFVPAVARPLVALLCKRLLDEFPRIRLRALEAYSGQVEDMLAHGRVDVGVFNRYGRGGVKGAELLVTSDIALVASRAQHTLRASEIPLRAAVGHPLVLPPQPNALVSFVRDVAQRQRLAPDIVLEAGSATLIRDAVALTGLCSLVPLHLARRDYGSTEFVIARVVKPSIVQKTLLATTTQRPTTLAARTVARIVRELAPRLAR